MLPLFTKWNVCVILSIGPIECLCSIRFWANFELPLPNLKSLKCSRYRTRNGLPLCPTYFMLQSMHVNWYMPHVLNLSMFELVLCWARILHIVFWVLYATLIFVLRKSLVKSLVCLPVYVNGGNFVCCCFACGWQFWLCVWFVLVGREGGGELDGLLLCSYIYCCVGYVLL